MKIICLELDWADEFHYPIVSLISNEDLERIKERIDHLKNVGTDMNHTQEYYFGTNEAFDFSFNDIISMIEDAKYISEEEVDVLIKFGVLDFGTDIVSKFLETYDYDEEWDD
jgi:hypothetical protein